MPKTQANVASPTTNGGGIVRSPRRKKDVFYNLIWPALEKEGWTKISADESMSGKPVFVPKVLELKEGQKGEDYYDDEQLVITRLMERRTENESKIADSYLARVGMSPGGEATPSKASGPDLTKNDGTNDAGLDEDQDEEMPIADAEGGDNDAEDTQISTQANGEKKTVEEGPEDIEMKEEHGDKSEGHEEDQTSTNKGEDEEEGKEEEEQQEEEKQQQEQEKTVLGDASSPTDEGNGKLVDKDMDDQDLSETAEAEEEEKSNALYNTETATGTDEDDSTGDERQSEKRKASTGKSSPEDNQSESEQIAESDSHVSHEDETMAESDEKKKVTRRSRRTTRKGKGNGPEARTRTGSRTRAKEEEKAEENPKPIFDVSDRDGSDYQSSDESQAGRKRKRKAATTSPPPAAKRGRGRPRGRPKGTVKGTGKGTGRPRGRPRKEDKDRAQPSSKRATSPQPRGKRSTRGQQSGVAAGTAMVDLSWKNGGKNFPKKVSNVGPNFNATEIEAAGTWKPDQSQIYCEQIWDPKVAEEKLKGESIDILAQKNVPHNKKEAAMVGLAEVGYDLAKFDEDHIVDKISTRDGTEWTDEERKRYHLEIFRARKDIREVARVTGKSINSCLAYYLGTFKKSDDYRILKAVRYEERLRRMLESEHDLDACAVCGDGGNLLICDGCESEFHPECMRPALAAIPEGRWECDECVDRAFVAARDSLLRNTKLFKRVRENKGASEGEEEQPEENATYLLKPTSPVLDIVTKLAQNISAALSSGNVEDS